MSAVSLGVPLWHYVPLCFLILSDLGSEEGQRAATQSVLVRFPTPLCNPGSFNEMGGPARPASAVLKSQREPSPQEGQSVLQPLCGRDPATLAKERSTRDRLPGVCGPRPPRADGRRMLGQRSAEAAGPQPVRDAGGPEWKRAVFSTPCPRRCGEVGEFKSAVTEVTEHRSFSVALDCLCE